jgi:hypothetical protein
MMGGDIEIIGGIDRDNVRRRCGGGGVDTGDDCVRQWGTNERQVQHTVTQREIVYVGAFSAHQLGVFDATYFGTYERSRHTLSLFLFEVPSALITRFPPNIVVFYAEHRADVSTAAPRIRER